MTEIGSGTAGAQEGGARVGEMVSEQATKAKAVGRRELRDQLNDRTAQVGGQARSLAEALRRSGTEVQVQGSEGAVVARITSDVADRLEGAGSYLERANGDEMLRDAERFIRTRPWLLASAAAVAGIVASRIVKASSERRYEVSTAATSRAGRRLENEEARWQAPQTAGAAVGSTPTSVPVS